MRANGSNPAVRRWALAALVAVALALALGLSACGGGSPAETAQAGTTAPEHAARSAAAAGGAGGGGSGTCAKQVGAFLDAMDTLRTHLVAGLSYEQYVGEVQLIRGTYHAIPVAKLSLECLRAAGTPGESALNKYIEASNAWSDCVEVPGCESASVEPALQSKWRQASGLLSKAQQGLRHAGSS